MKKISFAVLIALVLVAGGLFIKPATVSAASPASLTYNGICNSSGYCPTLSANMSISGVSGNTGTLNFSGSYSGGYSLNFTDCGYLQVNLWSAASNPTISGINNVVKHITTAPSSQSCDGSSQYVAEQGDFTGSLSGLDFSSVHTTSVRIADGSGASNYTLTYGCGSGTTWNGSTCTTNPKPVDGGWSAWSPASCPVACGQPASTQTRSCTNPSPSNGGSTCSGSSSQNCAATAPCACPNGANLPDCNTCPSNEWMSGGKCIAITKPTVKTADPTNVSDTTVTGNGNVTSDGGATVTVAGMVWSTTSSTPTLDNGNYDGYTADNNWADYGAWGDAISGLTPSTKYYISAYATNSAGPEYGTPMTFTTKATAISLDGKCAATHYGCIGTLPNPDPNGKIVSPNWVWSCAGEGPKGNAVSCTEPIPMPTNLTASCPVPGTTANVSWTLPSGYTLSYFRVTDTTTGVNPSVWIPENVSDTGPATSFTTSPLHNYHIWVHTRLADGSYSDPIATDITCGGGFTAPQNVTTSGPITNITETSADGGGKIGSDGGTTIRTSGLVWGIDSINPPTYVDGIGHISGSTGQTTDGFRDNSAWSSHIDGLTPNTDYYVRAYAKNDIGITYGNVVPFTSASPTPVLGLCGQANNHTFTYPSGSYASPYVQCDKGTPSNNGAFPAPGGTANWQCQGLNGGGDSGVCSAYQSAAPITSFTASPSTIPLGKTSTLSWTATSSCSSADFKTKNQSSGTDTVQPSVAGVYTYTITCGVESQSVTVTVGPKTIPSYQEH